MQYKVLKIEEDIDFGCEERQPGEKLMSVVLLEREDGCEMSLRHDDGLLYERDINEGVNYGESFEMMNLGSYMKEISMREIWLHWMRTVNCGRRRAM